MYTLQVFRTESKDHNEAFSKMERYIDFYNRNVGLPFPKEVKAKIDETILQWVSYNEKNEGIDLDKFKKLKQYPFKGNTILDFGEYLVNLIKNIDGIYCTSLGHLKDELYEFEFDDEAYQIDFIIDQIRCFLEDNYRQFYKPIYARIYGCIRFDDKLYNYKDKTLGEWSISELKKEFIDNEEIGDIFNDENDLSFWDEDTMLLNLDNGTDWYGESFIYSSDSSPSLSNENEESSNKKTFFVITYIKEDEEYPLEDCDV